MPYKRKGRIVYVNEGGVWKVKAHTKSPAKAEKMIHLLRGLKHGWKPTRLK